MKYIDSLGELGRRGQGLLHENVKGDTGVFSREGCRFLKSDSELNQNFPGWVSWDVSHWFVGREGMKILSFGNTGLNEIQQASLLQTFLERLMHWNALWISNGLGPNPAFLAPGTDFTEDNFSMDGGGRDGFRMVQLLHLLCA